MGRSAQSGEVLSTPLDSARPTPVGAEADRPPLTGAQTGGRDFQRQWQILERISRGIGVDEILDFIYEEFRGDVPFDRVAYAALDRSSARLVSRWARSDEALRIGSGYSQALTSSSLGELFFTGRPRIIDDLAAHLAANPGSEGTARLVAGGLASSLICPLVVEGRPLGFLFFNSKRPRAYSNAHVTLMTQLSAILALVIERGRLFDELNEQKATVEQQRHLLAEDNRRYREELALARQVQRALIHGDLSQSGRFESAMLYEPAAAVGGDLVDCISLGGDSAVIYVADALGHGVAAALVMSVVRTAFHGALAVGGNSRTDGPAGLLAAVNRTLVEMLDRQYVTAACVRVDGATRVLRLCLAGHPPAFLLRRATGIVDQVPAAQVPLGIAPETPYADVELPFDDGDVLLLYTDGVVEPEDAAEVPFGRDRLRSLLGGLGQRPVAELVASIRQALAQHTLGAPLEDDLTILAVQL